MAAERADAVGRAEELDEVILAYVEAVESGQSPDRAAWLGRYPHLAAELQVEALPLGRSVRLCEVLQTSFHTRFS